VTTQLAAAGAERAEPSDRTGAPSGAPRWRGYAETAAALLALLTWGITLTHASGGRAPYTPALAVVATVPLLLLSRTVRRTPPAAILLVLAPGTVALLLNPLSATGWMGLDDAASWWFAGLFGLGMASYARTARRRQLVAAVLLLVGAEQMFQAWFPWWGAGDSSGLMGGTFFWHNPFAAFQAGIAMVGTAVAMRGRGSLRTLAVLVTPWIAAGVWLSGSRAGLGLWLLGLGFVAAFAARGWRPVLVVVGQAAAAFGVAWLLASRWLMGAGAAAHGVGAAGRTEAAEGNFLIRLDYWRAAVRLAGRHLLTGSGFDSFAGAGAPYMPVDKPASSLVHNGWLQVLVDGGLVWAVPVVAVTAWLAARAVRRLRSARHAGAEPVAFGAAAGLLVLLVHALFDIDWAYPALLGLYALLAALLPWRLRPVAPRRRVAGPLTAAVVAVAVLAAASALVSGDQQNLGAPQVGWQRVVTRILPVRSVADRLPTLAAAVAVLAAAPHEPAQAVRTALDRTRRAAAADPVLAQQRALGLVVLGDVDTGLAWSAQTYPEQPRTKTVIARAEVLVAAGQATRARALVVQALTVARRVGSATAEDLAVWLTEHRQPAEASTQGGVSTSMGPGSAGEATR